MSAYCDLTKPESIDPIVSIPFLDLASSIEGVRVAKAIGFEMLGVKPGSQILDIGCGTGTDAIVLATKAAEIGGHVTGVDLSQAMVEAAKERASGQGLPLTFRQADIHALPFDQGQFDVVRIDRVLHFLPNPKRALKEAVRVTASGGRIVVTEPDWSTLRISGGNPDLTHSILTSGLPKGDASRIGAKLDLLLLECGLQLITVQQTQLTLQEFNVAAVLFSLDAIASRAVLSGDVTARDATVWLRSLQRADESRRLEVTLNGAIALGLRSAV